METIRLKQRARPDGTLTIPLPKALRDQDLEVLVVLQPIATSDQVEEETLDENGWPVGFFDETYGSFAEDPIERPPQIKSEPACERLGSR